MTDLNFEPMNPESIPNWRYLTDLMDVLKKVKGVTLIGVQQYVSSTDGCVANRTIRVGESLRNAKMKDLTTLFRLSPTCMDIESSFFIDSKKAKDWNFLANLHAKLQTLEAPDFSQFHTNDATVNGLMWTAWENVITSLLYPNQKMSVAQQLAYAQVYAESEDTHRKEGEREICTGLYQKTDSPDMFYIRGFEHSKKVLAPAIYTKQTKSRPLTKAQNAIKFGLELRMTKYRSLHLRVDSSLLKVMGNSISVAVTAERIRTVQATNEAKQVAYLEKEKAKKAKEIATK